MLPATNMMGMTCVRVFIAVLRHWTIQPYNRLCL